jgi:hypothetical protein
MDGSWSQRRNVLHCVVDCIEANSGKVVDFEILEKLIGFADGCYLYSEFQYSEFLFLKIQGDITF